MNFVVGPVEAMDMVVVDMAPLLVDPHQHLPLDPPALLQGLLLLPLNVLPPLLLNVPLPPLLNVLPPLLLSVPLPLLPLLPLAYPPLDPLLHLQPDLLLLAFLLSTCAVVCWSEAARGIVSEKIILISSSFLFLFLCSH